MDEKMRAEFELALARHFWLKEEDHAFSSDEGEYVSELVQTAWEFWQASRAALVVELPEPITKESGYSEDDEYYNLALKHCQHQIEAAGVRVKE